MIQNDEEPPVGSGGTDERREPLAKKLAVLIAAVSILGAVVVYRASVWFDRAAELDRETKQQLQLQQSIQTQHESLVLQDLQLFTNYREEVVTAVALKSQADEVEPVDPSGAIEMRDEAFEHLALARSLWLLFRTVRPDRDLGLQDPRFHSGCDPGPLSACVEQVLDARLANDIALVGLRPELTKAQGSSRHNTSVTLVGVAALLALSVLILSVARLLSLRWMYALAACAVAVLSSGVVLLILTEGVAR